MAAVGFLCRLIDEATTEILADGQLTIAQQGTPR